MGMRHYKGEIGEFDYDDEMFSVIHVDFSRDEYDELHFNESYEGPIDLPEGCISCYHMFDRVTIKPRCYMRNFDTSKVENMKFMFDGCKMPENFSLGDKFDTSNVKDMLCMFYKCEMPKNFSLGDKFDTSKVKDMNSMFEECHMSENFSLGDKFDTSNVKDMSDMFHSCQMSENFSLGDRFDTSNVENMRYMFCTCKMPENFSLGDKFDTSNVKDMYSMFDRCEMPENFSLGNKFDTSNVKDMENMFECCKMSEKLSLCDKFENLSLGYKFVIPEECEIDSDTENFIMDCLDEQDKKARQSEYENVCAKNVALQEEVRNLREALVNIKDMADKSARTAAD